MLMHGMSKIMKEIAELKETRTIPEEAVDPNASSGPVLNATNCKLVSRLRNTLYKFLIGMPMSTVVKSDGDINDADIPMTNMLTIPGAVDCMNDLRKLKFSKINQASSVNNS